MKKIEYIINAMFFFCEPISDEKLDKLVKKDFINRILTCKELHLTFIIKK